MRKIVLIVTAEVTAMNFYKGYLRFLSEEGWQVSIIARSTGALEGWAESEGATAYNARFKRDISLWQDLRSLLTTYLLLRRIKPEVVVTATPKAGLLGTVAARLAKIPVRIYQLWGLRLESEEGLKQHALRLLERIAIASSTQCVANSRSLAQVAEKLGLAAANSIKVLGSGSSHGVNLEYFSRNELPEIDTDTERFLQANRSLNIVLVGRLNVDKGVDTLVEAVSQLRAEGTSVSALLVGAMEDEKLAERVTRAPSYIRATGRVKDVRPYIASADVLCLPTLREGFPNVVLEAAALKVPSIVTDATGAVDSVVGGKTGWIFPVGDVEKLKDILIDISDNPALIREFGNEANKRVEREFEQSQIWRLQAENIHNQYLANANFAER